MKKVLIVSNCGKRRGTVGLIGSLLNVLEKLDNTKYHISLLDTNFFEKNHNPEDYKVDSYHSLDNKPMDGIMRLIPRLRSKYAECRAVKAFKELLSRDYFDIVVVNQIPVYADDLVDIAHKRGSKIVLVPFGSDILRVSESTQVRLKKAFGGADAVCGRPKTGTMIAAQEIYNVPDAKIKEQKLVVKGVQTLSVLKGKKTREEMMAETGIPYSDYNIVCGYSGRESHRHRMIIDALIKVKDVLPEGYQIIFPMTYGAGEHHEIIIKYASDLKSICEKEGLKVFFKTDYMSEEQLAYLHLVTDLFIEIQPTDNGNAFMIEALYAENQIVTGRWLNYQQFEQFGQPYYLIDKPEDLSEMLGKIFKHKVEKARVPQELLDYFSVPKDYDRSTFWAQLFDTI